MSNPTVAVKASLSGKPSLAIRFTQMLAAFEHAQLARADRVIRRFSYLGARIPGDQQKAADVTDRAPRAPLRHSLKVGVSQ